MPLFRVETVRAAVRLAFVIAFVRGSAANAEEGRWFSQQPEVASSRVRGDELSPVRASQKAEALKKGPVANWIWGEDPDQTYFVKTEFDGDCKSAHLKASCDNRMTLFLNGRRIAQSDAWDSPLDQNIHARLRPGKNELVAEIANAGGASGFALKIALVQADGSARYVVTDKNWQVANQRDAKNWRPVRVHGKMGMGPWHDVFALEGNDGKHPRDVFELLPGYQVELLFTVPQAELGSWVSIAFDNKGRLIASDQEGKGLSRITPPKIGSQDPVKVERLSAKITSAQGMLYAFGSLYLSVNGGPGSGFYRARDTDGDDQFDKVEKLAVFPGGGEHGPHALRLSPDGKSIVVICGNFTKLPEPIVASEVPRNWDEDHLIPRQPDGNGFARGVMAPGGWIARTDPDGKAWDVWSTGYRNPYDMDFNADGELFAYDADMEWDYGMPWYRPTRAVHATSGSEFGWRNGTGKWPPYYLDSLPPAVEIGPGSPVGVAFGYGTKFPAKYQKALYLCDWTFGTMYAIHLQPDGSSYVGTKEEFLSRTPLPLTDVAVGPDGAMYFTIGGRGTQSELYRVTYTGKEPTALAEMKDPRNADLRELRHRIEAAHRKLAEPTAAIALALANLGHSDRFIRYAARVALEHQPATLWQDQVLALTNAEALITGCAGLARQADKSLQPRILAALDKVDFERLNEGARLDLLRTLSLVFIRMGAPDGAVRERLVQKFDPNFPTSSDFVNRELIGLLVYLKSPTIIAKAVGIMRANRGGKTEKPGDLLGRNPGYGGAVAKTLTNPPEAQNIHYAFALQNLRDGWTADERKFFFNWLREARGWSGGASYPGFINQIDRQAFENASESERLVIEASGARAPFQPKEIPAAKGPGHEWTLDEVVDRAKGGLKGRNFANGERTFAAARCVLCHRFGGDGGATGPDLTQVAGRFGVKDLAEAIIHPSKVVSDQYRASLVATNSGKVYSGRVVGESKNALTILVDPQDSTKVVEVPRSDIDEITASKVSMMPDKLLNTLNADEVLDLLSYLLSRGDPKDAMFQKK